MFLLTRGVEPYDPPTTVLVQRSEPQGVSTVLSSTDFFQSKRNRKVILEQVDSFQLRDKYLFATTTRVRGVGQCRGRGSYLGSRCGHFLLCTCLRCALKSPPPRARFRTSASRAETRRRSVNIWPACLRRLLRVVGVAEAEGKTDRRADGRHSLAPRPRHRHAAP